MWLVPVNLPTAINRLFPKLLVQRRDCGLTAERPPKHATEGFRGRPLYQCPICLLLREVLLDLAEAA